MSRGVATLLVTCLWLAGPAPARAVPPLPLGQLPCPSTNVHDRTLLVGASPATRFPDLPGVRRYPGVPRLGLVPFVADPGVPLPGLARLLRGTAGVRWVRAAHVVRAQRVPNDPLFRAQYALSLIGAPSAWNHATGRRTPVLVAVLDTGVDSQHPDLVGQVRDGADFVDGKADATDQHFHGTAVAGLIAAASDNGKGIAGLDWGATVLAERVLDANGVGNDCAIAAGIIDATDGGAKVLNLSLGGQDVACQPIYQETLSYAHDHGALVVVAAGNDGAKGNPVDYPAGCAGAMAVGATDFRDARAAFSEYGPQIAIVAPGVQVLTTLRRRAGSYGYASLSGTSMSSPIVSGVAALLFSQHPGWTPDQVRARLVQTAKHLGSPGRNDQYGAGRVDAARALA